MRKNSQTKQGLRFKAGESANWTRNSRFGTTAHSLQSLRPTRFQTGDKLFVVTFGAIESNHLYSVGIREI